MLLSIIDVSFGQSSQPLVISNQNAAPTQQHNEGTAGTEDISTKSSNERSNRKYKERWDKSPYYMCPYYMRISIIMQGTQENGGMQLVRRRLAWEYPFNYRG